MISTKTPLDPLQRAQLSLEGLSVGDAFGQLFFHHYPHMSRATPLPDGPWRWTDDTHMALSIVENLGEFGHINQDALVLAFARRYKAQPNRGYGGGAHRLLAEIAAGTDWRHASLSLFDGGSYGNGAAMRAAPIGGFFAGDPSRSAKEAQLSAVVTHAHPEGQAGAMAVAVAAAIAATSPHPAHEEFIEQVLPHIPSGLTNDGIQTAISIPADRLFDAIRILGTGQRVSSQDTVPFCLWVAAHHLDDFEEALWTTIEGFGDADTTCAIVGGIVALSAPGISKDWQARREPLQWHEPGFIPPDRPQWATYRGLAPPSALVDFYRARCPDHAGRMITDVWGLSHAKLESTHDYIQWLFPLPERSRVNALAPPVVESVVDEFRSDHSLQDRLLRSFQVMLAFYGLEITERDGADMEVRPTEQFEAQKSIWLKNENHNYWRIARMLRCMHLLGLESYSAALCRFLEDLYAAHETVIGEEVKDAWRLASEGLAYVRADE